MSITNPPRVVSKEETQRLHAKSLAKQIQAILNSDIIPNHFELIRWLEEVRKIVERSEEECCLIDIIPFNKGCGLIYRFSLFLLHLKEERKEFLRMQVRNLSERISEYLDPDHIDSHGGLIGRLEDMILQASHSFQADLAMLKLFSRFEKVAKA